MAEDNNNNNQNNNEEPFSGQFFKGLNDTLKKINQMKNQTETSSQTIRNLSRQYAELFEQQATAQDQIGFNLKNINKALKDYKQNKKIISNTSKQEAELEKQLTKARKASNKELSSALEKRLEAIKIQKQLLTDSNELLRGAIPVSGDLMGKFGGMGDILGSVVEKLFPIAGIFLKIGGAIVKGVINTLKKAFELALQLETAAGNIAANIGLSNKNAEELLVKMNTLALNAMVYGGNMKDVATIFEEFAKETNRIKMFTSEDVGNMVKLGKATGIGVDGITEFAATLDLVGTNLDRSIKLIEEARDVSARMMLNSTKVIKSVEKVIEDFAGFRFDGGLSDMIKMSATANALRLDLSGMRSLADNLFDLENAVEMAAQLRVLGGNFADIADPIQLMYNAMNNPNKLFEDMVGTLQGLAQKNSDGFFYIPPAQRGLIRDMAGALGMSSEELTNAAIKQAEIAEKISAAGAGFLNDEDRIALANAIQATDEGFKLDGKSLSAFRGNTQAINDYLDGLKADQDAARQRMNFMDRLRRLGDMFMLGLTPIITNVSRLLTKDGGVLTKLEDTVKSATEAISGVINSAIGNGSVFESFFSYVADGIANLAASAEKFFSGVNSDNFGAKMKELFTTGLIKALNVVLPYLQGAIATVWNKTLGDTWIFGDMEVPKQWQDMMANINKETQAQDFIYSNKEGLIKFDRDDLLIGGTKLIPEEEVKPQTSNITPNIDIAMKGGFDLNQLQKQININPPISNLTISTPSANLSTPATNLSQTIEYADVPQILYQPAQGYKDYSLEQLKQQYQPPQTQSDVKLDDLNININGSLNLFGDGKSTKLTEEDLKQSGLVALALAVQLELNKRQRGTYKDNKQTAYTPI